MIDVELIKKLREETGAGVVDVKNALEQHGGDYDKAFKDLMEKGYAKATKKDDRDAKDGMVFSYIHSGGKVGSLVSLACETDFVAKTDVFQQLGKEIALQAATESYASVEEILNSDYVRDGSKKISDLITQAVAKLGEKIQLKNISRFDVRE